MSDVVWLREGSWPFQRLAWLNTASDIDRSYGVMVQGQAVFSLAQSDAAITEVQRGRMVEIVSSDGVAPWVGWIERLHHDLSRGVVSVECVDVATKLGERHTGLRTTWSGAAGLIARDLLFQANARNAFGLVWDMASEAGAPVGEIELGAMSLLDALNALADVSGEEWWIRIIVGSNNLELLLHWGSRRGWDMSQVVHLREAYEISDLAYSRDRIEESESVMAVGGGGALADRSVIIRAVAGPERVAEPGAIVQQASESHRRDVSLSPALAAERVIVEPRQIDVEALARAAKTRLEGPINTAEELRFSVNRRADWSLLGVGDTVTVIFDDPIYGTVQRTPRIWELTPRDGALEVKCYKQTWGLVPKLKGQDRALRELELS